MYPCSVCCAKKAENELPENELWQLYRAAYEQYQSEIRNGEKAYSRYVNDFYYYHLPCTSNQYLRMVTLLLTAAFDWVGLLAGILLGLALAATNVTLDGRRQYLYPLIPWDGEAFSRLVLRRRKKD